MYAKGVNHKLYIKCSGEVIITPPGFSISLSLRPLPAHLSVRVRGGGGLKQGRTSHAIQYSMATALADGDQVPTPFSSSFKRSHTDLLPTISRPKSAEHAQNALINELKQENAMLHERTLSYQEQMIELHNQLAALRMAHKIAPSWAHAANGMGGRGDDAARAASMLQAAARGLLVRRHSQGQDGARGGRSVCGQRTYRGSSSGRVDELEEPSAGDTLSSIIGVLDDGDDSVDGDSDDGVVKKGGAAFISVDTTPPVAPAPRLRQRMRSWRSVHKTHVGKRTLVHRARQWVRRLMEHPVVDMVVATYSFAYLLVIVVELVFSDLADQQQCTQEASVDSEITARRGDSTGFKSIFLIIDFVFVSIFLLELCARIFAHGSRFFFHANSTLRTLNIVDLGVIVASFAMYARPCAVCAPLSSTARCPHHARSVPGYLDAAVTCLGVGTSWDVEGCC